MTSHKTHQTKRWYRDHFVSFSLSANGVKTAAFRINRQRIEVPIPDTLWDYVLADHNRIVKLRRHVMERVIRERDATS